MKRFIDRASCNIQLILWVIGINIHNPIRDECTPDFSCCTKIRTPFKKRLKSYKKHWLMCNKGIYVDY